MSDTSRRTPPAPPCERRHAAGGRATSRPVLLLAFTLLLAAPRIGYAKAPAPPADTTGRILNEAVTGLLPDSLRTEVLVLASTHLREYRDRFRPGLLDSLVEALEAWGPDAIGVERDPPGVYRRIGADPEPEVGRAVQDRLELTLDRAVAVSDSLLDLVDAGRQLAAAERLDLVRHLVAAHRMPTATLHWSRLPEQTRSRADLLPSARKALETRAAGPANEIYSIGLRVARARDLSRVHAIDDATSDRVLDLEGHAPQLRRLLSNHPRMADVRRYMRADRRRASGAIDAGDLLPYYRWKNSPETLRRDVRLQWGIFLELARESSLAQKRIAHWEVRNLKMVTHIRKMALHHPGGRVLVVVGAGHKAFFDAYLSQMLDVDLVQLEEVLSDAGP